MAARQEGDRTRQIDSETALDPAEDDAGDPAAVVEGFLQLSPGLLAPRLLARQHRLAVFVLHAVEINLDIIADLELGGLAGLVEFFERDPALGFQSDVDQRAVALNGNDGAFEDGALEAIDLA